MGFFDQDVENSFDRMFDFNKDGKLDIDEQGMMFDFLDDEMRKDSSDLDYMNKEERREALINAGYDPDEFDLEDEGSCRAALEEAGFDPDEYDSDF